LCYNLKNSSEVLVDKIFNWVWYLVPTQIIHNLLHFNINGLLNSIDFFYLYISEQSFEAYKMSNIYIQEPPTSGKVSVVLFF